MLLVSYIQQYFNTSTTVLTNQVWKLLIALFKVSVFNHNEDATNIKNKGPSPYSDMNNITVSACGVHKLLSNLKIHKATGPDNIPARLLKELAAELTPVFTLFYQTSLDQGKVPNDWKEANVVPIFKKWREIILGTRGQSPLHQYLARCWNTSYAAPSRTI